MAGVESGSSVGALTSVAWTDMDGTGLSGPALDSANQDVSNASTMAEALLEAANGAFDLGSRTFSLNDLQIGAPLGERKLLSRTTLQTPSGQDSPQDWADFINDALNAGIEPDQALELGQWRRIADDLQQFMARRASERSTSDEAWGGVSHANGRWFVNGQAVSLLDLYTAARVNQLYNFDTYQAGLIEDMSNNNRLLQAAREWLSLIRTKTPAQDETAEITFHEKQSFINKWGFSPDIFTENNPITYDVQEENLEFQHWSNDIKSYIDSKDTDNQQLQIELTRKSDRRDEVLEATVSFAHKSTKTGNLLAQNLG